MKGPDFEKYILHYNIVALSETKLNAIDIIDIKYKGEIQTFFLGWGVAILVKQELNM